MMQTHGSTPVYCAVAVLLGAALLACGSDTGVQRTAPSDSQEGGLDTDVVGLDTSSRPDASDPGDLTADVPARDDVVHDAVADVVVDDAAETEDLTPPPSPDPVAPCDTSGAACWETDAAFFACRAASIDENYGSGNYNVHRWAVRIYGGATTTISLGINGGSWQPAIMLTRLDGATLYDGSTGVTQAGLLVTGIDDGRGGGPAVVEVSPDADIDIYLYLTGWQVIDSDYVDFLGTDSTYTLNVSSTCDVPSVACLVNGYTVTEPACEWLHYVAAEVVPRLQGTRAERLTVASRVAWWSLKEGVMFLDNPLVYSNCNFSTGDQRIGPVDECVPDRAWQVGLAAVQVPWSPPLGELEDLALALFPGMGVGEVLAWAANEARQGPSTTATIVGSTGDLRRSWLLRAAPVGFTIEEPVVTRECIDDSLVWCYGTGWSATQKFSPDRAGAFKAMDDIYALLDGLAP